MTSGRLAVELVIQTATAVLARGLAPREGVTILAGQAPRARALAPALARSDPERAGTYAGLLSALAADLRDELARSDDPHDLRAVVDDLEGLARALRPA